jgi:hypothetical protein
MISDSTTAAGETAWDLMLAAPAPATPVPVFDALAMGLEPSGVTAIISQPATADSSVNDSDEDRSHWGPYNTMATGRQIRPNWMVEDVAGQRRTVRGGFGAPGEYNSAKMKRWPFEQIAAHFGFPIE